MSAATQLALPGAGRDRALRTRPRILAAQQWPSNAYMIRDVAGLYLDRRSLTLDATYGLGNWWGVWRPDRLVTVDRRTPARVTGDFRHLPFRPGSFDAAAFDPPYVARGGRETSGDVRKTETEAERVGFALVDRALFIGTTRPQPHATQRHLHNNVSTLLVLRRAGAR